MGLDRDLNERGFRTALGDNPAVERPITFEDTVGLAVAPTITGFGVPRTKSVTLTALDTGGGIFAWQNPLDVAVEAEVALDITTKATSACTVDVGMTATDATTTSDNLLDGVDVGTAVIFAPSPAGTNGKRSVKVAAGKWITGSMKTGAAAGLAGTARITYTPYLA